MLHVKPLKQNSFRNGLNKIMCLKNTASVSVPGISLYSLETVGPNTAYLGGKFWFHLAQAQIWQV